MDTPRSDPGAEQAARQRVLVLGAGGFIGKRLVEVLAASDWAQPVAATHRTPARFGAGVETLRVDARLTASLEPALRGASAVVNCVAGDAAAIVAGARTLFDCCSRLQPAPRIVHLSTMAVYGTSTGLVDENAPLLGDWDDYSAAKRAAEEISGPYPNVVRLRPGIVYGPGSPIWSGQVAQWLMAGRLGNLGAAGDGCCNLVHVDDVVDAIVRGLRMPGIAGEAFNLSLTAPPTWNGYFERYAGALQTPLREISRTRLMMEMGLLAPPLKLAQILARGAGMRWQAPAPIRPWLLRLCRHPIRLDVRKAERVLGMRWMGLDQGLHDSARYFQMAGTARGGDRPADQGAPLPAGDER